MKILKQLYLDFLSLFSLNKLMSLILSVLMIGSITVQAEEATSSADECGKADIRYTDSPELTRAERIALMEKAFIASINRFELCKLTDPNNTSADSGGGAEQGGGGLEGSGNNSVASQEMQGTEAETQDSMPPEMGSSGDEDNISGSSGVPVNAANNGAIPEDIPSANNDDAIASQIRVAAEAEQDPEIKKKLWNEYRKYKGMNVVKD
jgi:hypothetical protein